MTIYGYDFALKLAYRLFDTTPKTYFQTNEPYIQTNETYIRGYQIW